MKDTNLNKKCEKWQNELINLVWYFIIYSELHKHNQNFYLSLNVNLGTKLLLLIIIIIILQYLSTFLEMHKISFDAF